MFIHRSLTPRFYLLQLIHPRGDSSSITLFTRWGRVGETGQSQSKGPFPADKAVVEFRKQFKAKAAWDFSKRTTQEPKPTKYTWIERHYEDEGASTSSPKKAKQEDPETAVKEEPAEEIIPDSKLPVEVQRLVEFIFNPGYVLRISPIKAWTNSSISLMQAHLASMNYDANKQPLGKLGQSTLNAGYSALKELAEIIDAPNGPRAKSFGGFVRMSFWQINLLITLTPFSTTQSILLPIDTIRSLTPSLTSHNAERHLLVSSLTPSEDAVLSLSTIRRF